MPELLKLTDPLGGQIILRTPAARIFYRFVRQHFDLTEPALLGKLFHTLRVAELCWQLAPRRVVSKKLAYHLGLLHDYARFYQWQQYHSFNDYQTHDHADWAVQLLFEQNEIAPFGLSEKDYALLRVAIRNHNKKEIMLTAGDTLGEARPGLLLKYCQLIRDCDKLDIFKRVAAGDIIVNFQTTGITPAVAKAIVQQRCVDKKDVRTAADQILTFVGLLFDLGADALLLLDLATLARGLETHYLAKLTVADQKQLRPLINEAFVHIRQLGCR